MELKASTSQSGGEETPALQVLCISPLFAPAADSEAFCAAKTVRALLDCGAEVRVLASESIRSKDRAFDTSEMWQFCKEVSFEVPLPVHRDVMHSLAMAVKYQTRFYSRWVGAAVRQATTLHRQCNFDLVYSRSLPMIAHVAAYWCAKTFQVPWIANINDPWEFHFVPGIPYPKVSSFGAAAYKFWLRRTLRAADLVTYPCSGLWNFHFKLAGFEHPAEIIPHIGSRLNDQEYGANPRQLFNLVHAGKLGSWDLTGRSTKALLLALRQFLDEQAGAQPVTRLTLVGPEDPETQAWADRLKLRSTIRNIGRVSYEQSLRHIAAASACILVEAHLDEGIFFPSKLADYIAARKPVLALSPRKGVVADMARLGGIVRVDCNDSEQINNAIVDLYSGFKQGTLESRAPLPALSDQFDARVIGKKLVRAAQSLIRLRNRNSADVAERAGMVSSLEAPTLR